MSDQRDQWLQAQKASAGDMLAPTADPLALIERQHAVQEGLCGLLEKIADGLPSEVDRADLNAAITCLCDELPLLQKDENDGLFPLLQQRCLPEDEMDALLEKLTLEHETDQSFAGDIVEVLRELDRDPAKADAEILGYMLRSFFESYRRHLFWERAVVLPMARKRLGNGDMKELTRKLQVHRKERSRNTSVLRQAAQRAPSHECGCEDEPDGKDGNGR